MGIKLNEEEYAVLIQALMTERDKRISGDMHPKPVNALLKRIEKEYLSNKNKAGKKGK